jgi:penicillin-insensitive murein DD-endopeptidase
LVCVPYSVLGIDLGRSHVHSKVQQVLVDACAVLATLHPDKIYVIGESGWSIGGRFKPHRTHQYGLAVDFMVPVLDAQGKSVP